MLKTMKIGLRTGLCCVVGSGWLLIAAPATEAEPGLTDAPLVTLPAAGGRSPFARPEVPDNLHSSDLDNLLLLLLIVTAFGLVVFLSLNLLRRHNDVLDYQVRGIAVDRFAGSGADDPRVLGQGANAPCNDQPRRLCTSSGALGNPRHEIAPSRHGRRSPSEAGERRHDSSDGALADSSRHGTLTDAQATRDQGPSQIDLLTLSLARQVARGGNGSAGIAGEIRLFAECGRHAQEFADAFSQGTPLAACSAYLPARREAHTTLNAEPPAGMVATASGPQDERPSRRQNLRYLIFTLGGERLAVSTLSVREILVASALSFEQDMPPCIRAVIDLRGTRVPVIDLGQSSGGRSTMIDWNTRIVILDVGHDDRRQPLGVLVDALHEIVTIAQLDNASSAALPAPIRSDFIQGLGQIEDHLIPLLDVGKGLSPDELAALAAFTQPLPSEETRA